MCIYAGTGSELQPEADTGRPREKSCNVMLGLKSISPGGKPWLMLMDVSLNGLHQGLIVKANASR